MSNSKPTSGSRRQPPEIDAVWLTRQALSFDLVDGRCITVPLSFYPALKDAAEDVRNQYEIHGGSVFWSTIRLRLTSSDLLRGKQKGVQSSSKKRKALGMSNAKEKPSH